MIQYQTVRKILARKSRADVETILQQAEQVLLGLTSRIKALSQEADFAREDADVIANAAADHLAALDNPDTAESQPTLGHRMLHTRTVTAP